MRILVVEDDPAIGRSLQLLFKRYNYTVDLATDGEAGRKMATEFDYDLILLDLILPRIDGVSLCQELRTAGFDRPILLLTGQAETQQKAIALNAGADDYVVKPFDVEELMARVQALLRRDGTTNQPKIAELTQVNEELRTAFEELQAAEEENKERLGLALDLNSIGMWEWQIATGVVTWNANHFHLLGYQPGEFEPTYQHWRDRIHPDDLAIAEDKLAPALENHTDYEAEYRVILNDGSIRWLLGKGRGLYDPSGQPERMVGVVFDISDRKQADQKILEQAALLDITSDAIVVRDLDQRIQYWNRGAERLYGWQAEAAIGQNACDLLSQDWNHLPEIMTTLLQRGEWQGEMHKLTREGQEVTVATRWTLARNEAGQPTFILSVDTDITEKKQLETQFYRAQRLESLGTLASGIAHDLNNVLTPILTVSQLLRLKPLNLDENEQEMLQMIEESAKRGSALIRQILTFTRGTRGECTRVEVAPILREVIQVAQQTFPRSITIHSIIPDQPLWSVYADSTYLHQVVMNLCVNARDAMPEGGTLTLSIANRVIDQTFVESHIDAKVGNFVVITVADTGSGIPPAVRDRIFEPFFTTKPTGQGTGLGLATVLGIIKNYGGFLQVHSEVGAGTQLQVYLPAVEAVATDDPSEPESYTGDWELVLIVDDDVAVQQSTRTLLENNFYMTLVASDGAAAIELYSQHQTEIALVMLDIMMPEMSGIELITRLKAINPSGKFIAMSGVHTHQEAAIATGAALFFTKPFATETLLKSLRNLLAQG